MAVLGPASSSRLVTCDPGIIILVRDAIEVIPIDFTVVCGHRTEDDQEAAFAAKRSKKHWPDSRHNTLPSQAVDLAPWNPLTGKIDWKDEQGFYLIAGVMFGLAKIHGIDLRWGGNWNGIWPLPRPETHPDYFYDLAHFEIPR